MTNGTPNGKNNAYSAPSNARFHTSSESKDFRYYTSLLLNNWYWLVLGLLIGLATLYIKLRYATPQYKVTGSVLIEDTEQKGLSREVVTRDLGFDNTSASMEDRIRILSSPELMMRVVDSLNLNVLYTQEGNVKTHELYTNSPVRLLYWNTEGAEKEFALKIKPYDAEHFVLYRTEDQTEIKDYNVPFSFGKHQLVLRRVANFEHDYPILISVRDEYVSADYFRSNLDIVQMGRSNILSIATTDEVPDRAIAIINRLVREYGTTLMEGKNEMGRRTMSFIEQRLNYVANELYSVEKKEEVFRNDRSLPLTLPEVTKNYIDKSNAMEQKVFALDNRANEVSNIERFLTDPNNSNRSLPFTAEVLASGPMVGLIGRYNDLVLRRAKMNESATSANPAMSTNEDELKHIKNDILISIQAVKQEVNQSKEMYRQQIAPLESQINMMPQNERELAGILREKGIRETLFLFLLQKREETAINVAAQVPNSRMLERAANRGIVSPKPLQLTIFFVLLGLGLPILFLYLFDMFSDKIRYRSDIDRALNLPFMGFIPHVKGKNNKLIINNSHSVLAESFRLLRSNLQNTASLSDKSRTLLICSTISGEGKSFVAANLALTLGLTGKKVLILGLDLRKPKLELYLEGMTSDNGVAQYLNGSVSQISPLIHEYDRLPNLHYVDCGETPKNPAELLMTDKLKSLFDYATKNYDFVVVDGAPVGLVADSFLLKEYIQQTVMVLRYGYSTTAHLKFIDEIVQTNKLPNMNILLNDVRQERGNTYNYGYYSSAYYQESPTFLSKLMRPFKKEKKVRRVEIETKKTNEKVSRKS